MIKQSDSALMEEQALDSDSIDQINAPKPPSAQQNIPDLTTQLTQNPDSFQHPPQQFKTLPFRNIIQVTKWLKSLQERNPHLKGLLYHRKVHDYYYLRCMRCSAAVSFFFKDDKIVIVRFNNSHVHAEQMRKPSSGAAQKPVRIKEKIAVDAYDKQKLKMKVARIYGLNFYQDVEEPDVKKDAEMYKSAATTLNQILLSKNYITRVWNQLNQPLPQILLAISPQMLLKSKRYSDVICFNFFYNLLTTRSTKKFQWAVGVFTGMAVNTEPIILGWTIFLHENVESYEKIFRSFMEIIDNIHCTFMTDTQNQIMETFKKMKLEGTFKGAHVINAATILINLQKETMPKNLDKYRKCVKAKNPEKFNIILNRLFLEETSLEAMTKFKEVAGMCCYSQIPAHFVGFCCSSLAPQILQASLQRLVPQPTNSTQLLTALQSLQSQLLQKSTQVQYQSQQYQLILGDPKLQPLRHSLDKRIMLKLATNYIEGLMLKVTGKSAELIQLTDKEGYTYKVELEADQWSCDCKKLEKSGVPCEHVLSVLCKERTANYMNYVDRRWLVQMEVKDQQMVKTQK